MHIRILSIVIYAIIIFSATVALISVYFYFTLEDIDIDRQLKFGVNFSKGRAEALELDWRENYLAILDDLGAKRLRLGAYWDAIEKEEGVYDFSELDWIVSEAEKRDAKIILAIGKRLPGWPECHEPFWVQNQKLNIKNKKLLKLIETVIGRYKNHETIWAWQVENEPFLKFGKCPKFDKNFLKQEINLVKSLDSRSIIVTDSGEFSTWRRVAKLLGAGDILGTTLYRNGYNRLFGYHKYYLPPSFYRLKSLLVKRWRRSEDIIVVELQAEPWVKNPPISKAPLEEQYLTMNTERFKDTLNYIRYTDFNEFYFWGAEWWYWLKLQGYDEIWSTAGELFQR